MSYPKSGYSQKALKWARPFGVLRQEFRDLVRRREALEAELKQWIAEMEQTDGQKKEVLAEAIMRRYLKG